MTIIDHTTYPNLGEALTREKLIARHSLSDSDREFINANTRGEASCLTLAVLLTVRRGVGCFPISGETHVCIVDNIAGQLNFVASKGAQKSARKRFAAIERPLLSILVPVPTTRRAKAWSRRRLRKRD
ncbi:DUF4158 domain-containing protein [Pseudochrobactrum kiredjianiae]|uniref:DUF4158 domain-containing protein n=1 Tax=Pseudochrobactrum kiredjianiae TaxID=386305 RepID=A0ABW3V535_9HYPH